MSEGENHQGDEVWEEVPEPEEINEEEARELPIDVFAEEESEPDEQPAGAMELARQPKRRPDRFIGHSKIVRRPAGVRCFVMINSQKMRQLGATQRGMHLLLNHEAQGHCRGYGHGEANPQVNPAFSPLVRVNA